MSKKTKKCIIALSLIVCLIMSIGITAGAISWSTNSKLTIKCHYVPILKDTATATPGLPGGSYDMDSLYTKTTVTAYNGSGGSQTNSQNCYHPGYVFEGWSKYTQAVASLRSIQSANATYIIGSNYGSATQYASVSR